MGTFAILSATPPALTPAVAQCHLNYWAVGGLLGRRVFLVDVGLLLEVSEGAAVTEVSLVFPFRVDASQLEDLSELMLDRDVARLIFGTTVTVDTNARTVRTGDEAETPTFKVAAIGSAARDPSVPTGNASRADSPVGVTCKFATTLEAGTYYARFRLPVVHPGRTWVWGTAKRIAMFDFRVADQRELAVFERDKGALNELASRFVPIGSLNLFVIVPASLYLQASSPPFHYIRTFEGRAWERYLNGRAVDLRRSEKLVLYHWKTDDAIDTAKGTTPPFRSFIQLRRESRLASPLHYLAILALVVAGSSVGARPGDAYGFGMAAIAVVRDWAVALVGAAGLLGLGFWLGQAGRLPSRLVKVQAAMRGIEEHVFRVRARL